jgi:hypothetical protein
MQSPATDSVADTKNKRSKLLKIKLNKNQFKKRKSDKSVNS